MGEAKRNKASGGTFDHAVVADRLDANTAAATAALMALKRDFVAIHGAMRRDERVGGAVANKIKMRDLVLEAFNHADIGMALRLLDPRHPTPDLVRIM